MLEVTRVQGVFFDVDGTLSDTDDLMVARLAHLLRPFRFLFPRWTPQQVARRVVMALEEPFNTLYAWPDRLGIDDELVRLISWLARLLPHRPPAFRLVPGVREMLVALSGRYPLAVVSARPEASTLAFLEAFDLQGFFCCVATAQTCEHTKPFPDPVLWAAERMGIPPAAGVMVGDTVVDIAAGRAAGAQTVGVLCGFGEEEELRRAGADLLLEATPDLTRWLLPDSR
ncbi:MAG TPA: HAD family hydrolase [Anaerolineae bacterium]|nr:HAD family hydrolase [Anaerolineae bacterium]HID84557.1 HAD family hydrolase [Anaerolineales bacterium]HIQ08885.1 HAD family hydrolase [Anaerolineaceae bacterium]